MARRKKKGPGRTLTDGVRKTSARRALIAILLAGAALRLWHIDSTIGGFHDHNEANYTLIAANLSPGSLLFPTPGDHVFLETPPFFAYVLALVFLVTGVSVLAARLISVLTSLGLVISTFLLGRRLFGEQAGLTAALLLAVTPVAVLTGRNVQTDTMFLFFLVTSLFFYIRAESGRDADWIRFGALFGLAIFTKLFAVVALASLVLWELVANRDRHVWLRKGFWKAIAVAAVLPGFFYGFHAVRDLRYLLGEVTGGAAASTKFPVSADQWRGLLVEAMWAFSPILAILMVAGAVAALWKRSRETLFVLFLFLGYTLFYLFVHKHSYYLLTLLPFGAILAGRLVSSVGAPVTRKVVVAVAVITGLFCSLEDLTAMKIGFTEFAQFGRAAADLRGTTHPLLVSREILASHETTLRLYDPKARLIALEDLATDSTGRLNLPNGEAVWILTFVPPHTRSLQMGSLLWRERFGLELFGWTFAEAHANPHYFRQGSYIYEHTDGLLGFGLSSLRSYPALALVPIPAGVALYRTPEGLSMRPTGSGK